MGTGMTRAELARRIEHTLLKPTATREDVLALCAEAREFHFRAVCVNPCNIAAAREALDGTAARVVTVVGFPLGANLPESKLDEAMQCYLEGANELDIVMNVGLAKNGDWAGLEEELRAVVMGTPGAVHKVIIETPYLDKTEMERAALAAANAGAEYVKTCTGFSPGGATVEDVLFLKGALSGKARIKASGGIRDAETALGLIEAGADLIGTSAGVKIMQEMAKRSA